MHSTRQNGLTKTAFFTRSGPTTLSAGSGLAYDAASMYGRGQDYAMSNPGVNNALVGQGAMLRARSRDLYRQNGIAAGAVDARVDQLVGSGFSMIPATGDPVFDAELADMIAEWEVHADYDGMTNFDGLTRLWENSAFVGGDCFVQMINRPRSSGLDIPLQLRIIESEFCPLDETEIGRNGERTVMGVVLGPDGRRRGYKMYREHPEDWTGISGMMNTNTLRVSKENFLHRMYQTRPGQLRGEPGLTRAIIHLYGIDTYFDNEMVRKNTASRPALLITRAASEMGTGFDDLFDAQSGDGEVEVHDQGPVGDIQMDPGAVLSFEPGETVTVSQPADLGGSFEPFMRTGYRNVAQALNIMYELVSGDYSNGNDRSLRMSENHMQRNLSACQFHQVIPQVIRPVYRRVIDTGVLSGAIRPPRGMDEKTLYKAIFAPEEWDYLQPVQEEQARQKRLEMGVTSREREIASMGERADQIDKERAQDAERQRDEEATAKGRDYRLNGKQLIFDDGGEVYNPQRGRKAWRENKYRF